MHRHSEEKELLESLAESLGERTVRGDEGYRVFVTGKGGAGKTLVTACLAHLFAVDGFRVLAVDADPQQNLAYSLGAPREVAESIVPLADCADYIEEKTGVRPGSGYGGMLVLNPDVRDVVERFSIEIGDLRLLAMGSIGHASSGCLCPENALLHAVLHALELREREVILMDTQGGLEHYGRSLAEGFGHGVIVTEPAYNSLFIAGRCTALSRELGVRHLHLVLNKVWKGMHLPPAISIADDAYDSIVRLPFVERIAKGEVTPVSLLGEEGEFSTGLKQLYRAIRESEVE